jgi:transcriptional regulator with XRE-family HTH domain
MAIRERQRWFLKEWRTHRGLTQQQLADRLETTKSVISALENGKQRWNQDLVELAAEALNCEPADLIVRDPTAPEPIWSIWDRVPAANRSMAVKALEVSVAPPPAPAAQKARKKAS